MSYVLCLMSLLKMSLGFIYFLSYQLALFVVVTLVEVAELAEAILEGTSWSRVGIPKIGGC